MAISLNLECRKPYYPCRTVTVLKLWSSLLGDYNEGIKSPQNPKSKVGLLIKNILK